jgi:hypothetical protein
LESRSRIGWSRTAKVRSGGFVREALEASLREKPVAHGWFERCKEMGMLAKKSSWDG